MQHNPKIEKLVDILQDLDNALYEEQRNRAESFVKLWDKASGALKLLDSALVILHGSKAPHIVSLCEDIETFVKQSRKG